MTKELGMIRFLRWAGSIAAGTLNGFAKFVLGLVVLLVIVGVYSLSRGDGLPGNIVLSLDLRDAPLDSAPVEFSFAERRATVMDILFALDAAARDARVKGAYVRLGTANLSVAQAEEIGDALKRFRASGKFIVAHAQGFETSGLGDYLAASSAGEIWMQPKAPFMAAGAGGGKIYLRGLLDKLGATPQIAKRVEYKSAADMYMASGMSDADREQTVALLNTWYGAAVDGAARARKLKPQVVQATFEASPQFSEDVLKAGLVDKLGFDDDALDAALTRAGDDAKDVAVEQYLGARRDAVRPSAGKKIALIAASGEIVDGSAGNGPFGQGSSAIGGDDIAEAIRDATKDSDIAAIVLRVDSPGGSVTASDQILDAVKKAQRAGKPVVVSMGAVAASGGYYISLSADKIVAEPGTVTGSIGVFTGKMSVNKTLEKIGVKTEQVGVGKNALMNSQFAPYTDEQWAKVNAEADTIYADFTGKVAQGRKLPIETVRRIARGRVWSGQDALAQGLVDKLGGFWTAVDAVRTLAHIGKTERVAFVEYPRHLGLIETVRKWLGGASGAARVLSRISVLLDSPAGRAVSAAADAAPRSAVELRAVNLPR
jgi:protease IV